jgi:RNA-directed DNA polymerase
MQARGPQVLETAKQGSDATPQKWGWVEASVWTERMLAALGNSVQGGKWFSLIDKVSREATLMAAWKKVQANRGAAGVDGQSVRAFGHHEVRYLQELEQALKTGSYRPQPVKRVEIPKGGGQTRPLGIPVVKDRIVQTAVKLVIEPIFEAMFMDNSYGFRPQRGAKDALRQVDRLLQEGYTHVVDADLERYFDTIPQDRLRERVAARISDGRVLQLVDSWLGQDIMCGLDRWQPTSGTPQGAVLSPLLANIYLHPLDQHMLARGYQMVRYADDFVVLCANAQQAQEALREVQAWVQGNGLMLHPNKTRIGDCRQRGQGFDFLGYRFEGGRRWVRKKSLQKLRDRVRELTSRSGGISLRSVIDKLNPVLRGWWIYFKHAHATQWKAVDGFVRRRLRSILRRQMRLAARSSRASADHQRWPNSFFAEQELFTLTAAHACASRSR